MLLLFSTICRGTEIRERAHNTVTLKQKWWSPGPEGCNPSGFTDLPGRQRFHLIPLPFFGSENSKTRLDYDPGHSCSVRELNVSNTSPPKKLGSGINSKRRSRFYVFHSPRTNCQGNVQLDRFFPTSTLKFSSEIAALSVWNCIQLLMLKPSERASCHEDSRLE